MAALITHIVFADKMKSMFGLGLNEDDYMIGTAFADIRYIADVPRELTHFKNIQINQLADNDTFNIGLKVHSLLDQKREEYLNQKGVYSTLPNHPYTNSALKIFEERFYYGKFDRWDEVATLFDKVLPQELDLINNEEVVRSWHDLIKEHLVTFPTDSTQTKFIIGMGKSESIAKELMDLVNEIGAVPGLEEILEEFYKDFENYI